MSYSFQELDKAVSGNDYFKVLSVLTSVASSYYVNYYNTYKKTAEEINADLFICDYFLNHACFDLAWKLGKPVVGISTSSGLVITQPPYKSDPIFGCHVNMENESFYNRFRCAIIEPLKFIWKIFRMSNPPINELNIQRAKVGVEPYWDLKGRISNILFLFDSFFGFEIASPMSPLHQEIGPILPDTFPNLTPELYSFLADHPRTIYFALGTYARLPPQSYIILLRSFIEMIDQNIIDGVIWATVRMNSSEFLSFMDDDFQISSILNNEHPHINLIKFAPQFAILSHENTKVFLSHGGAASSHESIYTATPMLVLPITGDQPGNAEKLEMAGVKDENGDVKINNDDFLKDWITPDIRMGFIRGMYLDVYGTALVILLLPIGGFIYVLWKIIRFFYSLKFLKLKRE
ncbi:UDP-Glycosyltransferase/glycogen phosphorylase [Gigaspora margarita]|uniref:UDP-Glycosyltransferase/glycogen phosphorylase n=1 Tax=Gigaspora margarita TaxID=4874 RepID=A0A8H4A0F8_GIGMA|nr:UDP-Glycosyltransferase/glycogen phosphorylase [Gigaspora margarita]